MEYILLLLREDGQEHVANILLPESDERPMSDEHCQLLSNKKNELAAFMNPSQELLKNLYDSGVISIDDGYRILSTYGVEEKCRHCVDILLSKPDSAFDAFISALCDTKQEHVASLLGYETSNIPMTDEHRKLLSNKNDELAKCMDPSDELINSLLTAEIIIDDDVKQIRDEEEIEEKCLNFVDILLRKPDWVFDAFISALCDNKQEHVASLLGYKTEYKPMTDEHREQLCNNELATCMNPYELIDALVTEGVFSSTDAKQIRDEVHIEAQCSDIVNILLRKPDSAFDAFISALCATKQEHVASLLGSQCAEKPMTGEHRQLLIGKSEELSQFIDPTHSLLNELVSVGVFSKRDMNSVASKSSDNEKSIEIVNILLRKSESSFDKFIEALNNTEQQHVVHILTGQGESSLSRVRRLVLWKARDRLVSTVDSVNTSLVAKLISCGVLTDDDEQRIETHKVNEDRTAQLVDIIARKSVMSYDEFVQVLKDGGHGPAAEELEGLELRGTTDLHFLSDTPDADRIRIDQMIRHNMMTLVSCAVDDISEITSVMKNNEFAVSEISEDDNHITFICSNEEALANFKQLLTNKTLDELFTQVFCSQFADQGLESLEIHLADGEFDKCVETFSRIEDNSQRLSRLRLPVELLEWVLMKTFIELFNDQYKTREAIQLTYSSLAAVCNSWWQTINGWPESSTKNWFKHKLRAGLEFVCRPYGVSPRLQFSLPVSGSVNGVTVCDNKLFVVRSDPNTILVFGPNNKQQTNIELQQVTSATDIVSCTETQQLFVAGRTRDSICCVWRVSLDGRQVVKWLPNNTTTTTHFTPWTLSVTSRRLLVTSHNNELLLYGADGVELKFFPLPDMNDLQHAVETPRGTFIASHREPQPRVCEVNVDGHVIRVYCDQQQLPAPAYLSLDSDGRIFVADCDKHRVLLLNSETLELERVLLDMQQHQLTQCPHRLCYTQQTQQLAICADWWDTATDERHSCFQLFTVR